MLPSKTYDFFVLSKAACTWRKGGKVTVAVNDMKGVQEKRGKKSVRNGERVSIEAAPWWYDNLAYPSAF